MGAYDHFCNILKVENVNLLPNYFNELWDVRKYVLYLNAQPLPI